MNWLSRLSRPKMKGIFAKRDVPENLWRKCRDCGEMIFHRDLQAARNVCPSCDHHMRLDPKARFESIFDDGAYFEVDLPDVVQDPLKFRDEKRYTDRGPCRTRTSSSIRSTRLVDCDTSSPSES